MLPLSPDLRQLNLFLVIIVLLIPLQPLESRTFKSRFNPLTASKHGYHSHYSRSKFYFPSIFRRKHPKPVRKWKKPLAAPPFIRLRPNPINKDDTSFNDTHLAPIRASEKSTEKSSKLSKTNHSNYDKYIESALYMPDIKCGTVPIYEKQYKKSINETEESVGSVRILHGLDTKVGEWPWLVRISECEETGFCRTCTGSLLNDRWFITAGHCAYGKNDTTKFKATLGLYDLVSPDETSFTMDIDKMIVHEDYTDLNNDLCLMRLAKAVKFDENIQPVCLIKPTREVLRWTKGKVCYNVGYGLTTGMLDAYRLQKLKITGRNPYECNSDKLGAVQLKPNTVCIGPEYGKVGGSCKGDSGGPDVCYDQKQGHWTIFGTVSFGPSICDRENDEEWLTVSVDLSNYRRWILKTILENS